MATTDYAKMNERIGQLTKANQKIIQPSMDDPASDTSYTPPDIAAMSAEKRKTQMQEAKTSALSSAPKWFGPSPQQAYDVEYKRLTTGQSGAKIQYAEQLMAYSQQIGGPNLETILGKNWQQGDKLPSVEAALRDFESQKQSVAQQAENRAAATGILTETMIAANQNLEQIAIDAGGRHLSMMEGWNTAIGKADEYVEAGRLRTQQLMSNLEGLSQDLLERHDFEKAHAMQVGVQSVIGSMQGMEKDIIAQFGKDSEEFSQFRGQKMTSLAIMQSNVHSAYGQLRSQIGVDLLKLTADAGKTMSMYENYQEQASLDVYKAAASSNQAYDLQYTTTLIGIEQLKTQNMTELASWIESTPVFSVELGPTMALISTLYFNPMVA